MLTLSDKHSCPVHLFLLPRNNSPRYHIVPYQNITTSTTRYRFSLRHLSSRMQVTTSKAECDDSIIITTITHCYEIAKKLARFTLPKNDLSCPIQTNFPDQLVLTAVLQRTGLDDGLARKLYGPNMHDL